jgi:hypothetical protein
LTIGEKALFFCHHREALPQIEIRHLMDGQKLVLNKGKSIGVKMIEEGALSVKISLLAVFIRRKPHQNVCGQGRMKHSSDRPI